MVCEDFWNAKALGHPEEYFIPWMNSRDHQWSRSFSSIVKRGTGENGRFAIKVMANQLKHINHGLLQIDEFSELGPDPFLKVFEDCHFVHLRRRNIVKQAVSRYVSQQTRINHLKDGEAGFTPGRVTHDPEALKKDVAFDAEKIYEHATNIAIENRMWHNKFSAAGIDPLTFWYEDVVKDRTTAYLNQICDHFGLENVPDVSQLRTLRRMANHVNASLVERFVEQ